MLDLESSDSPSTSGSSQEETTAVATTIQQLPSLMSLNVPPPPPVRRPDVPAVIPGNGSPSQQLHILVISQPPGSASAASSGRNGNALQAVHLYPGMKRNSDGETGPAAKRLRPMGDTELRLLVYSKVAGSIIGKGGSNISKLRTENHATILLPDCPGPERILTIQGNLDAVINVLQNVLPSLEEIRGERTGRVGDSDARLLVHQSQIGCIIGRGGAKVKELRESTGTRITVYSVCCPRSTDRIVQILGKPSDCGECIKQIIALVKESQVKGPIDQYNPYNYDESFAQEYGGYGEGGVLVGMGAGGGGGGMRNPGGPRGPERELKIPTLVRDVPRPLSPPRHRYRAGSYERDLPPPSLMGVGQPVRGGPGGMYHDERIFREDDRGHTETTQVSIPKDLAGAIIGKGGARIRKIRGDSGASITIDEPRPGSTERIITISGSSHQIWKAQYLLQQSVRENSQGKGGF
ncbi:heterogeneous nuclear ribonucleoprotein K-like isoform X2 [Daphnia pulex]|uniref:heterogeneous nuclear ribonucleoprotein K-like isoform X2 n=1 Tax=Daphnia pulex TaxID=6669 RepID=UPI001EE01231|nr:heterogeneous nuclear ribonucleoprotein K-like isoform X2 [Daphnia pulex]